MDAPHCFTLHVEKLEDENSYILLMDEW